MKLSKSRADQGMFYRVCLPNHQVSPVKPICYVSCVSTLVFESVPSKQEFAVIIICYICINPFHSDGVSIHIDAISKEVFILYFKGFKYLIKCRISVPED